MTADQRELIFQVHGYAHQPAIQLDGNACVAHCTCCTWVGHRHRWIFCSSACAYARAQTEGYTHAHDM